MITISIVLERMLLHSRATSISKAGIDNMIPSRVTGTWAARKRISDATAD